MPLMFWPVVLFVAISLGIGLYTYRLVQGSSKNYTVCNRSMPFFVIGTALAAQAVDGNATLGNSSLTYAQGLWPGLIVALGIAGSLLIVGRWLAAPLNRMNLLSLPEFYYRRYDRNTELLTSVLSTVSFTILVAGNMSAVAYIVSSAVGISYGAALVATTAIITIYTIAGGLYAAIWTDMLQVHMAVGGLSIAALWLAWKHGVTSLLANIPAAHFDLTAMTSVAAGAIPNWANLISLSLGCCIGLDFMERVFASESPRTAQRACYYAAGMTILVGACASFLGLAAMHLSPGLSDSRLVLPILATEHLPYLVGACVFLGVLGASMSTANGAILVIAVVLARNIWQRWSQEYVSDRKILLLSRLLALPTAAAACWIAYVKPEPGMLLVVAFDFVFAGSVTPLILGIYWRKATSQGALACMVVGTVARLLFYFYVPFSVAGLDTLLPPLMSLLVFVAVSLATQGQQVERNARLFDPLPEDMLLSEPFSAQQLEGQV